jgi:Leucine-rich repeat (LRR) protein
MSSSLDREIAAELHKRIGRPPICSFDNEGRLLSLNVADCNLVEVPAEIGELQHLRKLVLSNNPLGTLKLPSAMIAQTNLYLLWANRCELTTFPTELPPNLTQFSADFNQISSFAGIDGTYFPRLEKLSLFGNHLADFPEELLTFKQLQYLDLGNNLLSQLPSTIQQLQSLEKLNLTKNRLETLPEEFKTLTALQALYLGNNAFSQVPEILFSLHNLRELSLDGNNLQTLPDAIDQLSNLRSLTLARNNLRTLPATLARLQHLQKLDLHANQLDALPDEIAPMSRLETRGYLIRS